MVYTLPLIMAITSLMEMISSCELDIDQLCPEEDSKEGNPNIGTSNKPNKSSDLSGCDPISTTLHHLDDLGQKILGILDDPSELLSLAFTESQVSNAEDDSIHLGETSASGALDSTGTAAGSDIKEHPETQTAADKPTSVQTAQTETPNSAEEIAPAELTPTAETTSPAETSNPAKSTPTAETISSAETSNPAETLSAVETSPHAESTPTAETTSPAETSNPAETSTATESSPTKTSPPAESPSKVDSPLLTEAPSAESTLPAGESTLA